MSEPDMAAGQAGGRRGRPRVSEPCNTSLHVKLPEAQYDGLAQFASRHGVPLAEFVRQLLTVRFDSRL